MPEQAAYRYRASGPFELVVEVRQAGEGLVYRRIFEGEVVVEKSISPEQAGQLRTELVSQGWHME